MGSTGNSKNVIAKYLPVYFVLLAIAGAEFYLAYQNLTPIKLLAVLLVMAIGGAALAVMYFMHLGEERRSLFLTLIPATIFVLLMMNMIWSDSFRLLHMRPFIK
ncbi:MAG: cytochrome C oxidase subunit IV family protein [Acidobacteriia bacterium]|nr:cytochrome C oxidase subunit IV family protein [Terriglobia bacterium]